MSRIKIKPLSVNKCWQGRRYKTPEYEAYEAELAYILPKGINVPPRAKLSLILGLSNVMSDIDNPVKPFLDILQKTYGFNDRQIYKLEVEKVKVKKGEEYIDFELTSFIG